MCLAVTLGGTKATKTKELLIKNLGMDANLGAMTTRRQSRREASPLTRWSRSASKDIGSNREPRATASSDGSAILSCLASSRHYNY
jgi:hypothetical protein